ncbi:hypothetical protein VTJ04DRAFT_2643 [Mycothermus thermophilus]|uniref:uncharacterized protein n=1 Tax=Humicola insolens TaxID=85995 RepID=UPI0037441E6B
MAKIIPNPYYCRRPRDASTETQAIPTHQSNSTTSRATDRPGQPVPDSCGMPPPFSPSSGARSAFVIPEGDIEERKKSMQQRPELALKWRQGGEPRHENNQQNVQNSENGTSAITGSEDGPSEAKKRRLNDHQPSKETLSGVNNHNTETTQTLTAPVISSWHQDTGRNQITLTITLPNKNEWKLSGNTLMVPDVIRGSVGSVGKLGINIRMTKRWNPTPFEISLMEELLDDSWDSKALKELCRHIRDLLEPVAEKERIDRVMAWTKRALRDIISYYVPINLAYLLARKGLQYQLNWLAGKAGKEKVTIALVGECFNFLTMVALWRLRGQDGNQGEKLGAKLEGWGRNEWTWTWNVYSWYRTWLLLRTSR